MRIMSASVSEPSSYAGETSGRASRTSITTIARTRSTRLEPASRISANPCS